VYARPRASLDRRQGEDAGDAAEREAVRQAVRRLTAGADVSVELLVWAVLATETPGP
jgi:hypothetical protein